MALVQALLAFLSRSFGRMLTTVFGWAVIAMFGQTSGREAIGLSALVGAAVAWPLLLLGIVVPRFATFALAFVPVPEAVPEGAIRTVWAVLAALVPITVGLVMAFRRRTAAAMTPRTSAPKDDEAVARTSTSRIGDMLRGVPITMAVAAAFLVVFVTVPVLRIVSAARRRIEVHVPLITEQASYDAVGGEIVSALARHGFAMRAVPPPWWMTLPARILLTLGGAVFRRHVPERLLYLRGERVEAALYPNGLLLRGPAAETAWAHGVVVEALTPAPAFQTTDPAAQNIERQIRQVWGVYRANPVAHQGAVMLRSRLLEITEEIRTLPVTYEEWQIVYRQALQLGRALEGAGQLLEDASGVPAAQQATGPGAAPTEAAAARIRRLGRRGLVWRAALLAVTAAIALAQRPR